MAALLTLLLFGCSLAPVASAQDPPVETMVDEATAALKATTTAHAMGVATPEEVRTWSLRLANAEAASGTPRSQSAHLERMEALHAQVQKGVELGVARPHDLAAAAYYVAEARNR